LQAQKLETVGRLTAGIAHDFNNILGAILPSAQLIQEHPDSPYNAERAAIICKLVERANHLIQQLLSFARKEPVQMETIDLNALLQEHQGMFERLISTNIEIQMHLTPKLPYIYGDANQILQIVINLLVNARDAIPDRGQIVIQTALKTFKTKRQLLTDTLHPGTYVVLSIQDNGTGIPVEIRDKIFDPFFSTKKVGEGTGLGLSMVYGITQRHKAALDLKTAEGKGTTFSIYFPAINPYGKHAMQPVKSQRGQTHCTILVLEKDDSLREIFQSMLTTLGHQPYLTSQPAEALKLFRQYRKNIDLAILDSTIPAVHNNELIHTLRKLSRHIPILLSASYGDQGFVNHLSPQDNMAILTKPFTLNQLQEKIEQILTEPGSPEALSTPHNSSREGENELTHKP